MKRQRHPKRLVLGITGSFSSGKTTVAKIFKAQGAQVIDADEIAHRIIRPKSPVYKKIIMTFGKDILKDNLTIDRHRLGNIVFGNKGLLKKLNRITHPKIIRLIKTKIKTSRAKLIVLDAPLLIEAKVLRKLIDKLIVVKIARKKQLARAMKKTHLSKTDILKRLNNQLCLQYKVRLADFVIDNSGTVKDTKRQVIRIWRKLQPQMSQMKTPQIAQISAKSADAIST